MGRVATCLPPVSEQLIDPWLDESEQVDFHAAFSGQRRTTPALASSIGELEAMLEGEGGDKDGHGRERSYKIDAIILSHPFTDHMHPPTLQDNSLSKEVPFFVTADAHGALQTMLGGKRKADARKIVPLPCADHDQPPAFVAQRGSVNEDGNDHRARVNEALPSNVMLLQIAAQERFSLLAGPAGIAWAKLHGAVLLLWKDVSTDTLHSLLYSPHGITAASIPTWLGSSLIHKHAILTSLDRIVLPKWLSGTVNLGLPAALQLLLQDRYNAKHIVATHDERKEAKGLVASLLKRYWLGSDEPDNPADSLSAHKLRDRDRERQGQEAVDAALAHSTKAAKINVLDVGEVLMLVDDTRQACDAAPSSQASQ